MYQTKVDNFLLSIPSGGVAGAAYRHDKSCPYIVARRALAPTTLAPHCVLVAVQVSNLLLSGMRAMRECFAYGLFNNSKD
jgi:hypothetical protein